MKSGIYYIQNIKTGQLYIGQSVDIPRRKREHLRKLRNNSHVNTILQNSFNKYGEDSFIFDVFEYCNKEDLDDLEIKYMDFFNVRNKGFNICEGGVHVCPDNSNENHGMWREDISNNRLKELYLQDYNSTQLAEIFGCSRRTINRRLKKIFGEEYDKIIKEKHKKGVSSYDHTNPNIKNEDILKYYSQGLNSVEIGKILNCADKTVMNRLKILISDEEYAQYKKNNVNKKMSEMRKTAHTEEAMRKSILSRKKYTMWDVTKVHYHKMSSKYDNNPVKRFSLRYCGKDLKIGLFVDFLTPLIIHELMGSEING